MTHFTLAHMSGTLLAAAMLLLSGAQTAQAQPKTAATTSYTRYSEWMSYSMSQLSTFTEGHAWNLYRYDNSVLFDAMMDTWLATADTTTSAMKAVKKRVDGYASAINSDTKNYTKSSSQLDYVRPMHFQIRYHQNFPKVTLSNYDTQVKKVVSNLSNFTRLTYSNLKSKSSSLSSTYTPWQHKSDYAQQVWLDGTFMGLPVYTLAESSHFDDAVSQMQWVDMLTYDSDSKLYRHAYDNDHDEGWSTGDFYWYYSDAEKSAVSKTDGRSAHAWARAVGWYAMACMELMDNMDAAGQAGSTNYTTIKTLFQKIMSGVVSHQQSNGVWYQVLDAGETYTVTNSGTNKNISGSTTLNNYYESTASAIFSYCLLKGYNKGWLGESYKEAGEKAYCGVVKQFVTDNGSNIKLTKCCTMGSLNMDKGYDGSFASYIKSFKPGDNDSKGTGPFIWASLQAEKLGYVLKTNSFAAQELQAPVITATGTATDGGYTSSELWQTVTIKGTEGAEIRYTTDGTEPDGTSKLYEAPFKLYATATVKAVCLKGSTTSDVATSRISIYQTNTWDAANNTLVLDELATDYTPVTANDVKVTVKRPLLKDKWNAVCLPFAVKAADFAPVSVTLQTFSGVSGNTFVFGNATSIAPGQPFIVKPEADIQSLSLTKDISDASAESKAETHDGYTFEGTYTRKLLSPANHLFVSMATQHVVPPTGSNLLKGLRAFFTLPATAKGKDFSLSTDGVTDRINTIETGLPDASKPMYNLSGQRVRLGFRGIIVQNGKKYLNL